MPESLPLVLVVEDSNDDSYAFRRACRGLDVEFLVHRCTDVRAAREYMDASVDAKCPVPVLVLRDLHWTGSDGRVLLRELKASPELRAIPVVIYSTSSRPEDVRQCLGSHASAYHVKPLDFDAMQRELKSILGYWTRHPLTLSAVS